MPSPYNSNDPFAQLAWPHVLDVTVSALLRNAVALLFFAGLTYLGLLIIYKSSRTMKGLAKYEFEHRTAGGVVQFATYEASVAHEGKKTRNRYAVQSGALLAACSIFILLMILAFSILGSL